MLSIYPACFFQEENGGYSVVFPDLNYLATQGDDFEKSVKKTLTIPAWLNTAALEKNVNFSKILQEALKKELHLG